jgi:phage terminase small subunit
MTERQIQFAENYLTLNNGTQAAIKAGYSQAGAHVQASVLLKNPKIQDYMEARRKERQDYVHGQLAKYAEKVVNELFAIAMNSDSDAVRMQAIKDIMDRAGYKPVDKVDNRTEHGGKIEFGFIDPNSGD